MYILLVVFPSQFYNKLVLLSEKDVILTQSLQLCKIKQLDL